MPTNEELSQQLQELENKFNHLQDVYYRTNFIDHSVFKDPVTFNNIVQFPYRKIHQRTITTTTATTTPIFQSTLGLYGDGLYQVTAVVNGKNGTAKYGAYTLKAVIKFVFGAATVLASTITAEFETDASWNVTITTSGINYLINVVSSADSIVWRATVEEYL
jgi:hypothetical protein